MKKGLIILPLLVVSLASCDLSVITDMIPFWPKGDTSDSSQKSSSSSSKSSGSKSSSSSTKTSSKTSASSSGSSSSSSKTSYIPGDGKTFTKVKEASQMVSGGKYIFTCIEDGGKSMKVWNGSLSKEDIMNSKAKGGNYNTYSQTEVIGDVFTTDNEEVLNSYFVIQNNSNDTYTVILASSIDQEKVFKLTSSDSFAQTTSTNAENQKFTLSLSDGNASLNHDEVSVWFNKNSTSDRFGVFKESKNTLAIQLFILNE